MQTSISYVALNTKRARKCIDLILKLSENLTANFWSIINYPESSPPETNP